MRSSSPRSRPEPTEEHIHVHCARHQAVRPRIHRTAADAHRRTAEGLRPRGLYVRRRSARHALRRAGLQHHRERPDHVARIRRRRSAARREARPASREHRAAVSHTGQFVRERLCRRTAPAVRRRRDPLLRAIRRLRDRGHVRSRERGGPPRSRSGTSRAARRKRHADGRRTARRAERARRSGRRVRERAREDRRDVCDARRDAQSDRAAFDRRAVGRQRLHVLRDEPGGVEPSRHARADARRAEGKGARDFALSRLRLRRQAVDVAAFAARRRRDAAYRQAGEARAEPQDDVSERGASSGHAAARAARRVGGRQARLAAARLPEPRRARRRLHRGLRRSHAADVQHGQPARDGRHGEAQCRLAHVDARSRRRAWPLRAGIRDGRARHRAEDGPGRAGCATNRAWTRRAACRSRRGIWSNASKPARSDSAGRRARRMSAR